MFGTVIKGRHDDCARAVYLTVAKNIGLLTDEVRWWHRQAVQGVLENEKWKMLWDHPFKTDRMLKYARPDIVIENKETQEGWIVEIGVCLDTNLQSKMAEKSSKYIPLAIELSKLRGWRHWKIVAVVVGTSGSIPVQFTSELCKLPLTTPLQAKRLLADVQHATIYSAVNIMRNVSNV